MSIKASVVFAVLQAQRPDVPPERAEVISEAVSVVSGEFPHHPIMAATLVTAIRKESNFDEGVHSGEIRGAAGEICLTQIHPTNGFWKRYVTEFDDLGGVDLESTTNCLRAAAATLSWSRTKCLKERYKTNWAQAMWTRYHYGNRCWLSPHAYERTRAMYVWNGWIQAEARLQNLQRWNFLPM